jgi:tRNA (guanine37-N1)-methyltransferase
MQFDIVTIFPDFFTGPLDYGILRRAREAHLVNVNVHDLREFTHDRHRTVDDRPFGGGEGMVMKPEPLFEAVETILGELRDVPPLNEEDDHAGLSQPNPAIILLSASGQLFRQATARRLAQLERIVLLCGRYEGVDERVSEHLATDELSIGDFVLSGGDLAAALIIDAVTRLIPGALGNEDSSVNESFSDTEALGMPSSSGINRESSLITRPESPDTSRGILDFPHYTRPANFRGWPVPDILMGGNHEQIRRWRREKALEKTRRNRPDLLHTSRREP